MVSRLETGLALASIAAGCGVGGIDSSDFSGGGDEVSTGGTPPSDVGLTWVGVIISQGSESPTLTNDSSGYTYLLQTKLIQELRRCVNRDRGAFSIFVLYIKAPESIGPQIQQKKKVW